MKPNNSISNPPAIKTNSYLLFNNGQLALVEMLANQTTVLATVITDAGPGVRQSFYLPTLQQLQQQNKLAVL